MTVTRYKHTLVKIYSSKQNKCTSVYIDSRTWHKHNHLNSSKFITSQKTTTANLIKPTSSCLLYRSVKPKSNSNVAFENFPYLISTWTSVSSELQNINIRLYIHESLQQEPQDTHFLENGREKILEDKHDKLY